MLIFVYFHCNLFIIVMSKSSSRYSTLENLFSSKLRVRVLKFLFRNYPINIGAKELARRIQESPQVVKQEIKDLQRMGLIKKHNCHENKEENQKSRKSSA